MTKNRELVYALSIVILALLSIFSAVILLTQSFGLVLWLRIIISIGFILITLGLIVLKMLKINFWTKILLICDIIALIIFAGYLIIWANGWLIYFSSADSIKELILSAGIWGQLVFVIIQFLQVTLLPIPAMVSTLAGVAIYGPFITFILSCIGIILGSLVSFLIGRIFGRPICEWVAGKENTNKYATLLNDKGKFFLPVMFLLPVFPDDLICMIAGITAMKLRFFLICTLLVRPIGIVATCYIGSGEIIPFDGWGLFVWPFIIIFLIFLFWFCYKYQSQIENFFKDKFSKNNINNLDEKNRNKNDLNLKKENDQCIVENLENSNDSTSTNDESLTETKSKNDTSTKMQ